MGNYTRPASELMLIATRGQIKKYNPNHWVSQILVTVRREHSRKPDESIDKIKYFWGGSYKSMKKIELFCRTARDGWACWGNEIDKFEAPEGKKKSKHKKKKHN